MSSSREESPDWIRCFQGPTHSALTLSSDSESSPNDSTLREDSINEEKPSLHETSQFPEKEKNQDIILSDRDAEYPSKKTSRAKSLRKQIPTKKKKKLTNKGGGNESDVMLVKEETSEKHIEPHAPDHSVWTLSSDSESCPANSLKGEDYIYREESSAQKHLNFQIKEGTKMQFLLTVVESLCLKRL
ncbi:hypothetical protein L1049_020083 [Liquidambar formosana]|uniref:Uncharacterized protein n=1 Tax=Liquidambar formosana TaxID=63359 RepID=A0AAP0S6X7_LIQFO